MDASRARGDQIFAGLGGASAIVDALTQDIADLINAGRFDEETATVLSARVWESLGFAGSSAVASITDELAAKYPEFEDTFIRMTEQVKAFEREAAMIAVAEGVQVATTALAGLSNTLQQIGNEGLAETIHRINNIAASSLNIVNGITQAASAFRTLSSTAQLTGKTIALSMAEATAGITLVITGVVEAASALGLLGDTSEEELKGVDKLFDQLGDKIEEWGQEFTDVLVEFIKTGELNFEEFVNSILEDILRLTIQTTITDPIVNAIQGAFAKGAAFEGGNVVPFAKGGVVSSPTVFPMANGMGLMGEAGPEAVMPLKRLPSGDLGVQAQGGGVKIEVIDQRTGGVPVQISERTNADGQRVIRALIRDEVKGMAANGTLDRTLNNNFGIRRRPR